MVDDSDGYKESPATVDRPEEKALDGRDVGGVRGDGVASAGCDSPTMARQHRRTPARSRQSKTGTGGGDFGKKIKGEGGGDLI